MTDGLQEDYLLELRGEVREGLRPTEESMESNDTAEESDKVYYVVHPQVDLSDLHSSLVA